VNSGSLATAVLFMAQSKDYYRYIGVEILIRIIESGDGLDQVSPQKDFFYHTLVDMIDNYTSQQHAPDAAAPDDLLQRKISDRVAVMRRTADRLRKLKEPADSLDAATASAAAAAANDSSVSPLLPSSPVKSSLGKKTRRTTAPIVVAAMTGLRNSPLSLSARAAFDAKVANLEDDDAADAASAAAAQEAVASVVQALSPRGPRGSSKRAPRSSAAAADDGAPSAPSHELVDFEVPPPPPLPDSLRRGTVLPDDDAGDAELPPPLPDSALLPGTLAPPPPLPLPDVADSDDVDQFTLPRLKSSQPSRSASAETDVLVLRKAASLKTKKKRAGTEMLRSSPPRDGAVAAVAAADTDVKRSTSPPVARPTSVAPPPPRAKSSSSVRAEVAAAHAAAAAVAGTAAGASSGGDANAEELRQLKMRLMLAAGSMGTAQQALTSDDSWANQMALAKAQADYKSLQNKIAEVQQRAGSSAVVTTPISGGTVRAVKLTSTSRFSVRERTASIDAGTGQIADVKTAEEKGREERLLELIGSIAPSGAAAGAVAGGGGGAAAASASETAERSSETNGADSSLSRSESSTPSNSTRSPAPAEAQFVHGSFHSELTSSARSLADTDTADELGLVKPRPASSDGADARLLTDARQLKRMYAAQEILETEVRYVRCLESMVDNYKRELERSASTSAAAPSGPQSLASPAQIRTLFSNAQAILNTNRVLLNQVRARVGQWDAHSRLGDVFLRIADFFKIYIEYANNYDAAHEQFDQLIDSSEAFVRFCEAMELRDGLDLGLEDLLIMPVQRLPRYVMLLESLLKYTPAVHPDRDALQQAATKIQEISQQINDTNREVEQRRRVFEIQQSLALAPGQPGIVAPHRIFQRDAQAVYYDHETSRRRRVHVYLFNDLVLLTSAAARPANVVATCSLRTARTARISDQKGVRDGDDITNAMVLIDMSGTNPQQAASGGRHQHVLCWATPEERDAWLAAVDEAKAETIHAMISKNQMV
jgi:hypothetical protein